MNKTIEEINDKLNGNGYETDDLLKKARRRLYRLTDDSLSVEDYIKKCKLLVCIKEMLAK